MMSINKKPLFNEFGDREISKRDLLMEIQLI